MKKKPLGKVRKIKRAEKPMVPPPPFDPNIRHSIKNASFYLGVSRPHIDKKIAQGSLEVVFDGTRKFITGRSLAAQMLPPPSARAASSNHAPAESGTVTP